MATRITVKDSVVRAHLGKLQDSMANMTPVLQRIGEAVRSEIQQGFQQGRAPAGHPWAPLKVRQGQPLMDTGNLSGGITYNVLDAKTVEVGTPFEFAHVHQYGATIRPKKAGGRLVFQPKGFTHPIFAKEVKIPARPFLPEGALPPTWRETVLEVIESFLAKQGVRA